MRVAVWDVDVPVRLDDGQLQPPEGAVEQLTTGCLKTQQCVLGLAAESGFHWKRGGVTGSAHQWGCRCERQSGAPTGVNVTSGSSWQLVTFLVT